MKMASPTGFLLLLCCVFSSSAATVPGALPRHTLLYSSKLEEISVGLLASTGKREITMDGSSADTKLETESGGFLLGYDFASWLTGFTTLGAGRIKADGDGTFADQGFKGSLGLSANLWRTDLTHPEFMEGTLSFKMVMEYKQLTSTGSRTDYEWNELTVSLPITYEMFTSAAEFPTDQIYSLAVYAGPCFSSVDGTITAGGRDTGFSEADAIGMTAGADLYFSDNLALNGQVMVLQDPEITVGLFYHF